MKTVAEFCDTFSLSDVKTRTEPVFAACVRPQVDIFNLFVMLKTFHLRSDQTTRTGSWTVNVFPHRQRERWWKVSGFKGTFVLLRCPDDIIVISSVLSAGALGVMQDSFLTVRPEPGGK